MTGVKRTGRALGVRLGLGLVCAVSVSSLATASGFELREQGAIGQGTSMAGVAARNDDPSMMFWNPAALTGLRGFQAVGVASGIIPAPNASSGSATRNAALGGSAITGSLGGDFGLDAFVPAGYMSLELAPDWRFGMSLTAPWGLVTKYPNDFIGRYHALTSSLKTINIAPAIAWQATPTLSVGLAVQVQYAAARLSSAVDFGAVGASSRLPFVPGSADGRSTIAGENTSAGVVIGAQWQALPSTRLGLSFRSAVFHDIRGVATFDGAPFPLSASLAFQNSNARAKLVTPETLTFGVTHRLTPDWTLLAGLQWTNWSRFQNLIVRFDTGRPASITYERWHDSIFASLGAEYRWNDRLTLRGGVAYDQSPVPSAERTPRIPDSDRYWLSVGASYAITPAITVTAGYSHIFVRSTTVSLSDPGPDATNLLRGNLTARYGGGIDILATQVRFAF